jgi:hypothetical protein
MVINDKVKSKVWTERIDKHLITKSWENQALAILKYFFPSLLSDLFVSDAPDIQDRKKIWGIEVVRVILEEEGRLFGEMNQYFNSLQDHDDTKAKKYREKIIRDGGVFTETGIRVPLTSTYDEEDRFQYIFRKKLAKLTEYKKHGYINMGLFMFHNEIPIQFVEPIERMEYLDAIQHRYSDKYHWAFIVDWDNSAQLNRLTVINFENSKLEIKHIPSSIMMDCVRYGRLAAEGGISADEPIWI